LENKKAETFIGKRRIETSFTGASTGGDITFAELRTFRLPFDIAVFIRAILFCLVSSLDMRREA
jgi:hypothetical protein